MDISSSTRLAEVFSHLSKSLGKEGPSGSQKSQPNAEDQSKEVAKLRSRDTKVRAHEQAHASAAGGVAKGGPRFTYQRGPDGKLYAVGGEVSIDTSSVPGDPEATIRKARQIRAAALAPADPSSQDRAVAASATAMEVKAMQELQQEKREQPSEKTEDPSPPTSPIISLFV